jgi:hypothetical protein
MTIEPTRNIGQAQRFERLAACYERDLPSDDEIDRARRRLARRGVAVRRVNAKLFLALVVQGFVLGVVTLAAAAWLTERVFGSPAASSRPAASEGTTSTQGHGASHRANRARPTEGDETVPAPPRAAFADLPRREPLGAPHAASGASGAKREAPAPVSAAPSPTNEASTETPASPLLPSAPVDEAGPWSRVSRALASKDWTTADRALAELGASLDPATRDAAELARAQLWMAHGNGERFRSTLERLARSGATALVRRRAAGLLEQLR